MYRNQYHYYWTDYHFLFTSNLSSYTYNGTCLIYSIYLKLNDKGYNENYYFDKNTKLIINGKTIDLPLESINVDELEGGTIWYSNVLEMTSELQNIKIETSQETKKIQIQK